MATEEAPSTGPEPVIPTAMANAARIAYLNQHRVPVPVEAMYTTSLLEFIIGDRLDEAKAYHENRMAVILDQAVAQLTAVEDQRRSAQARQTLLNGVIPGMPPHA